MGDWDDDDFDVPDINQLNKKEEPETVWSDEEGHDVHAEGEWDDSDAEESGPSVTPVNSGVQVVKPKEAAKAKKKALEEKEKEMADKQRAAALRRQENGGELEDEDEMTRKLRLQKLEEESDLDNARDLFSDGPAAGGRVVIKEVPVPAKDSIEGFKPPAGDEGMEKLAHMISKRIMDFDGKPGYMTLLKGVIKGTWKNLSADELKELSALIATQQNAKIQLEKGKKKKANNKKAGSRNMDSGGGYSGGYGQDDYDDYDFM